MSNRINKKYSIPSHYEIKNNGAAFGIVRHTSRGSEWIYPVHESNIAMAVSKTYEKIMIARKSRVVNSDVEVFRLTSWNKKLLVNFPVFDVLFGEKFLYLKVRLNDGNMAWGLANEDMNKLKIVGDFEIVNRDKNLPYNIPTGTEHLYVKLPDGKNARLDLFNGELSLVGNDNTEKKQVESLRVNISDDRERLLFVNPDNGAIVAKSINITDLEAYISVFENLLHVPKINEVTKVTNINSFLAAINVFENSVDAGAIMLLYFTAYDILKHREMEVNADNLLKGMISLAGNVGKSEGKGGFKALIVNGAMLIMRVGDGRQKVHLASTLLQSEDEEGNIVWAVKHDLNNCEKIEAKIKKVSLLEKNNTDEENAEQNEIIPRALIKRMESLCQSENDFKADKVNLYRLTCEISGIVKGNTERTILGNINIVVKEVVDVSFKPKKISSVKNKLSYVKLEGNWIEVMKIENEAEESESGRSGMLIHHPNKPRETIVEIANSLIRQKSYTTPRDVMNTTLDAIKRDEYIDADIN